MLKYKVTSFFRKGESLKNGKFKILKQILSR